MDPEKISTPDACSCFAIEWHSKKIMSVIRVCKKVIPKHLRTVVILKEFPNIYLSVIWKQEGFSPTLKIHLFSQKLRDYYDIEQRPKPNLNSQKEKN